MALLTTYTDANKYTTNALQKNYYYGSKTYQNANQDYITIYKITRHATKVYSYVGMDETTARACATSKTAQYTRQYKSWSFSGSAFSYSIYNKCGASIQAVHDSGDMWRCDISVNEQEDYYTTTQPTGDLSSYFDETGRNYDE